MTRRFISKNLSIPIPVQTVRHQLPDGDSITHWVKPSDWLKYLLKRHSHCFVGDCNNLELQLESFWKYYRQHHAQHKVFESHSNDLKKVLPLSLFGDEGRGPKRGNFLIWSLESSIGLWDLPGEWDCECTKKLSELPPSDIMKFADDRAQRVQDNLYHRATKQCTNMQGHSYVTRHLLWGLPHWVYKSQGEVLEKHIELLSEDMTHIFTSGVEVNGDTFFGALVAIKGDMKHHVSLGLERSYHKLLGGMMCSLCHAGAEHVPFESHEDDPHWASTMYVTRPWSQEPTICKIPYDQTTPEKAFVLDAFHLVKVGLGRDLAGSMVVLLARMGFFDDSGIKVLCDLMCLFLSNTLVVGCCRFESNIFCFVVGCCWCFLWFRVP